MVNQALKHTLLVFDAFYDVEAKAKAVRHARSRAHTREHTHTHTVSLSHTQMGPNTKAAHAPARTRIQTLHVMVGYACEL